MSGGRTVLRVDTVTDTETTTDHRRWTRHEHHLADATVAAPAYARWAVPTRVVALIESAPCWIRRHLLIVEGTRIVERTLIWETTRSSNRIVEERDVPVYAPDPALILGDYVLAGWSEPENQNERNPVHSAPGSSSRNRIVLREVVGLCGGVLAILLTADAILRSSSGTAWSSAVAAIATAVTSAGVIAWSRVRGSTAFGTIPSTVESKTRVGVSTHER